MKHCHLSLKNLAVLFFPCNVSFSQNVFSGLLIRTNHLFGTDSFLVIKIRVRVRINNKV